MPGRPADFAVGRKRHLQRLLVAGARQRVELELEPAAIVGAHVHRQRLGDRAEAARLLVAVDPGLEGHAAQPLRAVGAHIRLLGLADEDAERGALVERLDHVRIGHVAGGQLRPAGPAQRRQRRLRDPLEAQAPVGLVRAGPAAAAPTRPPDAPRRADAAAPRDAQHRADHGVGPIGGDALESGAPGFEVQRLEVVVRIVLGDVDGLADRRVDEGLHRRAHAHVVDAPRSAWPRRSSPAAHRCRRRGGATCDRRSPRPRTPACCRRACACAGCRSTRRPARCRRTRCRRTRSRWCRWARSTAGASCGCRARGCACAATSGRREAACGSAR